MTDSLTRKQLEELMMSLSFNIHTNEDIQFLNQLYNNNQADMYIFRLTNTKIYFESIIIPYCKEHWKEIIKTITNENIKNEFILNFGEISQMSKPQPSEIPVQEINVQQTNDNKKPKDINKKENSILFLKSNVNEPLLEKSDEMEENRKKRNSTSVSFCNFRVVGGIGGIFLFGIIIYYFV